MKLELKLEPFGVNTILLRREFLFLEILIRSSMNVENSLYISALPSYLITHCPLSTDWDTGYLWAASTRSHLFSAYYKFSRCFFSFRSVADTFQVLIQYPDVVSAQSAKLVSSFWKFVSPAADSYTIKTRLRRAGLYGLYLRYRW